MNPLTFFDYIYYSILYWYYKNFNSLINKDFQAISILSLIQFLNCVTLLGFFLPSKEFADEIFLGCVLLILFLNLIRYKKVVTYLELCEKWDDESSMIKLKKMKMVIAYYLVSIVMFIVMVFCNE